MPKRERKSLLLKDWPVNDCIAWNNAFLKGSLLDNKGVAAHWSKRSRETIQWMYGHWLSYLKNTEQLDDHFIKRVTKESINSYIDVISTSLQPWTVWCYISKLYDALRVMSPDTDWSWLRDIHNRLARNIAPSNHKLSRIKDSSVLYQLGISLMREVENTTKLSLHSAIEYRDGLMIALLAARPLRRSNLASIRINQHILYTGEQWCLSFERHEMKNRRPYYCLLPHALTPYIDTYLHVFRCLFSQSDMHNGFWASAKGVPMSHGGIYDRIIKRTKDAFGEAINPHLFRDCAATTLAIRDPDHVRSASSLLGHGDLRTTEKYYNQASTLQASKNFQSHMLARREEND